MSAAKVVALESDENPAIEHAIRANKHNRNRIIEKLKLERAKGKGEDKELVELTLAFLGGSPRYPFDPVFWMGFSDSISKRTTTSEMKCAALHYLLSVPAMHILRQARKYDPNVLPLLAKFSIAFVTELNKLARNKAGRNALRTFSRLTEAWPILKSQHWYFSQHENDFLGSLEVGQGLARHMSKKAKWEPEKFANQLWHEINSARETTFYFRNDERLWLATKALALPDFDTAGAAEEWAALAFELCARKMKGDREFRSQIEKIIPRSKQKYGKESWLRGKLRKKFRTMLPRALGYSACNRVGFSTITAISSSTVLQWSVSPAACAVTSRSSGPGSFAGPRSSGASSPSPASA